MDNRVKWALLTTGLMMIGGGVATTAINCNKNEGQSTTVVVEPEDTFVKTNGNVDTVKIQTMNNGKPYTATFSKSPANIGIGGTNAFLTLGAYINGNFQSAPIGGVFKNNVFIPRQSDLLYSGPQKLYSDFLKGKAGIYSGISFGTNDETLFRANKEMFAAAEKALGKKP